MSPVKALLVLFFSAATAAMGQPGKKPSDHSPRYRFQTGLQVEVGVKSGKANQTPDYMYRPVMVQVEFQKPISSSLNSTWYLDYFIQPQFNSVRYREGLLTNAHPATINSWETGVNAGLIVYKAFYKTAYSERGVAYFLASSGPHYVSAAPSRQSNGFIFSDNWRFGVRIPVHKGLSLDLRGGRRHISNANLNPPNGGINNKIAGIGLRYTFY
ncbi:MAG TPA: acyloxyacyl hydrolase [Sphingobacteriaceae bacterium]